MTVFVVVSLSLSHTQTHTHTHGVGEHPLGHTLQRRVGENDTITMTQVLLYHDQETKTASVCVCVCVCVCVGSDVCPPSSDPSHPTTEVWLIKTFHSYC